jgi:hypothetical protein
VAPSTFEFERVNSTGTAAFPRSDASVKYDTDETSVMAMIM